MNILIFLKETEFLIHMVTQKNDVKSRLDNFKQKIFLGRIS